MFRRAARLPSTRARIARALLYVCILGTPPAVNGAVFFEDGFESGVLGPQWSTSGTNTWRVEVTGNHAPATGAKHLVLDDSVDDAIDSVAEAILKLDLRYKRNVELTFTAKSLGNEPHHPPAWYNPSTRAYDGVAVSTDGGASWRPIQSLGSVSTSPTTFSYWLDQLMPVGEGNFRGDVLIRFSEYDNSPAPIDGIAIDDVRITGTDDPQSWLEIPTVLTEGSGAYPGRVNLSFAPSSDYTVTLVVAPGGVFSVPPTVIVPAGQTFADFTFSVENNEAPNGPRYVDVSATASGLRARVTRVTVYDDEPPTVTLHVPAQVHEGVNLHKANGVAILSEPISEYLQLDIRMNPSGQTQTHSFIVFHPGQTRCDLRIYAQDDIEFDGDVAVTITASGPGIPTATGQTVVIDNEVRELSVSLPASVQEGSSATGVARIPGYLKTDLVVYLTSSDSAGAAVPESVTIPARALSKEFTIQAADDLISEGSRSVTITARAETFAGASAVTILRDNEVAGYLVRAATDIVDPSNPVSFTVSGADQEGNKVSGASGIVNVEIVQPDGTSQPAVPPTLTLTGTDTTGTVTLPPNLSPPLRIRVADAAGKSGESQPFDFLRTRALKTADLVWDAARQRIYASVASDSPSRANEVVAIDPVTAQITGSVPTGHNPGKLALTSGSEALYVALDGNGTIARIDPATMSVVSSFAVGSNPHAGTLFARDICTLRGNPNLVVVGRNDARDNWPSLAVYDNGVPRQNTIEATSVEPSAEANIVFAMPRATYGLARIQIDSNGLTVANSASGVYGGGGMVADGNILADVSGGLVDGGALRILGSFYPPQTFHIPAVRPEMAVRRVYFVEPRDEYTSYAFDKIAAYDSSTFAPVRRLTMPAVDSAASLIRWGATGLAFRTNNNVVVVNGGAIVPSAPETDLAMSIEANPPTAASGEAVTYQINLRNHGPNAARNSVLTATLSDGQIIESASATGGESSVANGVVSVRLGDVAPGAIMTLNIVARPQAPGSVSCTASVASSSVDVQAHNNAAFRLVPVGFNSAQNAMNHIRIVANNALYDAGRDVIWATVGRSAAAPLGRSLIAIDPHTGEVSDPIPLDGHPAPRCMSLSGNGRYLYVGYSDAPAVARFDLGAATPQLTRLYLGGLSLGYAMYPQDIEALDGDGTSFIIAAANYVGIAVYDGEVRRPNRTGHYGGDRIERTTTPNVFVGTTVGLSPQSFLRLVVTSSGVSVSHDVDHVIQGREIVASGNLVLSDEGSLANSGTMTSQSGLGMRGTPCLDAANGRAYLVYGPYLRAFDTATGNLVDTLRIPPPKDKQWAYAYDWANRVVRWAADGFAITGPDQIYLTRWSGAVATQADHDDDGISDAWEAKYFGTLNADMAADADGDRIANGLEYLFGTSPRQGNAMPLQSRVEGLGGSAVLHLVYTRRADLHPSTYRYEASTTLGGWTVPTRVSESVITTQEVDGVQLLTIDAAIPAPNDLQSFARLRWLTPSRE